MPVSACLQVRKETQGRALEVVKVSVYGVEGEFGAAKKAAGRSAVNEQSLAFMRKVVYSAYICAHKYFVSSVLVCSF